MKTLGEMITRNARLHPDDAFLAYDGRRWTHAEAYGRAMMLSAALARDRLTHLHFVPTMIQALIDHPAFDRFDLSSVETIVYAAAPMPVPVPRRALAKFGPVFVGSWGTTEGGGTFLPKHVHDPDHRRLLASIGRMQQYGEMRIVDDAGQDCAIEQPGEIGIKSDYQFSVCWNRAQLTADAGIDGWLKTGDMGYFDACHNVFLADWRKDMIISGGENIYSVEVEGALADHRAIAAKSSTPVCGSGISTKSVRYEIGLFRDG